MWRWKETGWGGVCVRAGFQERSHLRPCARGSRWGCSCTSCKVEFWPQSRILTGRSPKIDISLKSHIWAEVLVNFQSGWAFLSVTERKIPTVVTPHFPLWEPGAALHFSLRGSLHKATSSSMQTQAAASPPVHVRVLLAWEAAVSNLATRCRDADLLNA